MIPFIALGLVFLMFARKSKGVAANAITSGTTEDSKETIFVSSSQETEPMFDEPYSDLLGDAIGAPYWYGKGSPATPWEDIWNGSDCSGSVLMAHVRLGIISNTFPDMGAGDIADACDPIAVGQQIPGDFAIYPGHIMLVYSEPRASKNGHSAVWGQSGGDSKDLGDNPNACIKVFDTATYNNRFVCYGRWKKA